MRHYRKYFLTSILVVAGLALTGCDNNKNEMSTTEAENMINAAFEAKQFERMQSLADSLEKAGVLSKGESYYWQRYANYQIGQRELAEGLGGIRERGVSASGQCSHKQWLL